jgi:hypothetical protein
MKTLIQRSILVLSVLAFNLPAIHAQDPVPVVITPRVNQYRVIDISKINVPAGGSSAAILESMLNELGSQGWVLVTASGSLIILRR